ncbi:MAG: shikimate kinase [Phocaeicola sp.]
MKRFFLIGYMGSGKTTLGKAFAKSCGLTFIDLDWHIEECYRKSVATIFAEQGEQAFRELERKMLHEVGEFENVVISTGGGTPCFFDNMIYMNRKGRTIYLEASRESLFKRLKMAKQQRPLLVGKTDEELMAFIIEALQKREQFYKQAHYTFHSEELENKKDLQGAVECLKVELAKEENKE